MTITARRFQPADAEAVSRLISRTLQITNAADYSAQELDEVAASLSPEKLLWRATWMHFYVFCHGETIVGCGAVGPYWDQIDECSFFNIFVLPEYQGRGVGSKIIETLEKDELFIQGYIAKQSSHSLGSTVDLTLLDMKSGKELDRGSAFDFFGEISHPDYQEITDEQFENRMFLQDAMKRAGFLPMDCEWWHFTLADEPYPDTYFQFPVTLKDFI